MLGDLALNPFEETALPHLQGRVLDFGCGMGNLAIAAAQRGCTVVALDGSAAAIAHLQRRAAMGSLAIEARQVDLRHYDITTDFDVIVSIGLLAFFDCTTAFRTLANLQAKVRAGGVVIINSLIEGTTYLDMFGLGERCLFSRPEMAQRFAGWNVLHAEQRDFEAPNNQVKSFVTLIAQKPHKLMVAAA